MNIASPSPSSSPKLASLPTLKLPPSTMFVGLLALAYALPGLFGHAPWKSEDAIGVGIVHQMLAHGQWLIPHLAGEAYLEDGPLYYWFAALLAKLFSFALDIDDGARLASGIAVFATWFFLRDAARELHGRAQADGAMLVLLGCLGLVVHAHETLAELGLLAGLALSWHGLALAPRKPGKGGIALGLGMLIAFMCKGFSGVFAPVLTAMALAALSAHWRTRSFALSNARALAVFIVPLGIWLFLAGPQGNNWLLAQWNAYGLPSIAGVTFYFKTLSWAAWPAWPVALWMLWDRRVLITTPALLLPALGLVFTLLVLLTQAEIREIHALPTLLPLALLAGAGVERLRRGAAQALAWFGALCFSFFGALVWLGWFAMLTGTPAQIARNFAKLEPGHVLIFEWLPFLVALFLSLAWLYVLFRSERSPYRCVLYWASGATLVWGLVMTLWISWIDYGKSYQGVARTLSQAVAKYAPPGNPCIQSYSLGESQRAVLDYHAEIVTLRMPLDTTAKSSQPRCGLLLVQTHPDDEDREWASQWRRVWEGSRPRDRERYRLYVRATSAIKR
ncbi:MAG: ArnT family glycosyltransferase [Burkholderiales bacterium]